MEKYDYIILGAGISGCSVAYELSQHTKSLLLVDQLSNIAKGASGAAGAFLSPLLGKSKKFNNFVNKSLKYTTNLYQNKFLNVIDNCGTLKIPKNKIDKKKFEEFIPHIELPYKKIDNGYFFNTGSVVNSFGICKMMTTSFSNDGNKIQTKFNFKIENIYFDGNFWILNNILKTKNLILTTGADIKLLDEFYIKIKPVWGRRIDIKTSTLLKHNYQKNCSVSKSFPISDNNYYKVSIGATQHIDIEKIDDTQKDNKELLKKANDIIKLEDIEITKGYNGARACSFDYFPIVGEIIDSKKTIQEFPNLVNGTEVSSKKFIRYKNLYILNGVGGRGFTLAPYLAKQLVDNIINNTKIDKDIVVDRLFTKEVKRIKIDN